MTDTPLHDFLKWVGFAYLHNQNCNPVATEVRVRWGKYHSDHEKDNKAIVDVVGIQNKPIYETKHYSTGYPYKNKIGEREIVRGIEVKCSKADFKNGYSLTGCNYNYILAPLGLIKKTDLPKDMGFLEYNKHKFQGYLASDFKYALSGLKITKKPRFQENPTEDQINRYVWKNMISRQRSLCVQYIGKELQIQGIDEYTRYRNYVLFRSRNGQWKAEFNTYTYPREQGIGNTPEAAIINLLTVHLNGGA